MSTWPRRSKFISTKRCTWYVKLTEKVSFKYLKRFQSYRHLKSIFWPPRSNLTSEVKGHFNKKLRTWYKKLTEKVSFKYLKRFQSYKYLKSIFWPPRSNLTSEVKAYFTKFVPIMPKNQHAKFGFNMLNGFWVIWSVLHVITFTLSLFHCFTLSLVRTVLQELWVIEELRS